VALSVLLAARSDALDYVAGEVLVRYRSDASVQQIEAVEKQFSLVVLGALPHLRLRHYQLPAGLGVPEAIDQISSRPGVESVDPNVVQQLEGIPSDPLFPQQWGLHNTGQLVQGIAGSPDADIDWPEAMDLHQSLLPVTIAVVDTGVALDHPEILANTWFNPNEFDNGIDDDGNGYVDDLIGWNFINGNNLPLDDRGHGTNVAFTAAGVQENAEGGSGTAPAARIMALRVADQLQGFGTPVVSLSNFLLATTYAAAQGARIINFSAGGTTPTSAQESQIEWLDSQGVLLVAAAGNGAFVGDDSGDDNDVFPVYPASYPTPNILSVAATGQSDQLTGFSNFGDTSVDLAAPGENMFVADVRRGFPLLENFEGLAPGWTVGDACSFGCPSWGFFVDALFNSWVSDGSENAFGSPVSYLPWTDSWLDSPVVSLAFGPVLVFREWHALASGDALHVEVSTNGIDWTSLASYTGFSASAAPGTSFDPGDLRVIDLKPYEGIPIQISFRLITNGSSQADGVYVDDVFITQVEVFSYDGTQYQYTDGTSFSAPLVAGVAALLMSQHPELSHHEILDAILASVDPLPGLSGKVATGGRLNARAAIQYVPEPSPIAMQSCGLAALFALARLRQRSNSVRRGS
jgi:subtilisin family serine protease